MGTTEREDSSERDSKDSWQQALSSRAQQSSGRHQGRQIFRPRRL